jgi:hypothetical protein
VERTAASAFTRPEQSDPQATEWLAVDRSACTACVGDRPRDSRRATVPLTNGVAIEVPSSVA